MSSPQAMRLVYNFLVLLIISVFAGSIIPGPAPLYQPFFLTASHSTSPIHLQPINANNLTFWINKPTLSYCFDNLNHTLTRCPQGDFTALRWGGYGVGLDTQVPAGQDVFVASNGALSFTRPHGLYYPDGAIEGPFNVTLDTNSGSLGQFIFTGNGSTEWLACPIGENGPWQIFAAIEGLEDADVPGGCVEECIFFGALTPVYPASEPAAFQYE